MRIVCYKGVHAGYYFRKIFRIIMTPIPSPSNRKKGMNILIGWDDEMSKFELVFLKRQGCIFVVFYP